MATISPGKSSVRRKLKHWYKTNTNLPGSYRESPTDREVTMLAASAIPIGKVASFLGNKVPAATKIISKVKSPERQKIDNILSKYNHSKLIGKLDPRAVQEMKNSGLRNVREGTQGL